MKTHLRSMFFLILALCICTRAWSQFAPVPLPGGLQPTTSEMVVYQNSLYMVLQNAAHNTYSLYRKNSSTFTSLPLPANYLLYENTEFEELGGNLYFMPNHVTGSTATAELMRYDGTTFTPIDIPDALLPAETMQLMGHRPFAFQNKLYIEVISLDSTLLDLFTVTYWIMYDGTAFTRMRVPVRFTCQPVSEPAGPSDKKIYQGKLVTRYHDFVTDQRQLIRYDGSTVDVDTSHPSYIARPGGCEMEIYNGYLYIPTYTSSSYSLYGGKLNRYDGVTQTAVTMPATLKYANSTLEVYNGLLMGAMYSGATPTLGWYAFNGTTFTEVPLPTGTKIIPLGDQRVYDCSLYIVVSTGTTPSGSPIFGLYTYTQSAACTYTVIPSGGDSYEWFDIRNYGPERDWCWTDVVFDWSVIQPCVLPDCIDPFITVSLSDKGGAEVWRKQYDKPFQATLPIDDKEPLGLKIIQTVNKTNVDFVTFDAGLVAAGIESIQLQGKPRARQLQLTATADKGKKVPFIMSLLNKDGKVLWQETFTAPLSKSITAQVKEQGVTLHFKPVASLKGVTGVSVFPNPAAGAAAIDISTDGGTQPARITITNFYGKVVYLADVVAPVLHHPVLAQAGPGLYVVTVTTRDTEHRQVLVVK